MSKNINYRISELLDALKENGIKQYEFAEKLGVTETAVSAWKNGRRNITEQTIKAICREFNVEYIWLVNGIGPMIRERSDSFNERIDLIMKGENEFHKNLIKACVDLDTKDIEDLRRILNKSKGIFTDNSN